MERREFVAVFTAAVFAGCLDNGEQDDEQRGSEESEGGFGMGGAIVFRLVNVPEDAEVIDVNDERIQDVPEFREALEEANEKYGEDYEPTDELDEEYDSFDDYVEDSRSFDEDDALPVGSAVVVDAKGETSRERDERIAELHERFEAIPECEAATPNSACVEYGNIFFKLRVYDED